MKKIEIILFTSVILLTLLTVFSVLFFSGQKKEIQTPPPPIPVFVPSPSTAPYTNIPKELEVERQKQENYAEDREAFFKSKPWFFSLPLQSTNYFVSYNPETDTLIVELYYLNANDLDKSQQISQAKNAALNAMILAGIDINKQKIEYFELLKK